MVLLMIANVVSDVPMPPAFAPEVLLAMVLLLICIVKVLQIAPAKPVAALFVKVLFEIVAYRPDG